MFDWLIEISNRLKRKFKSVYCTHFFSQTTVLLCILYNIWVSPKSESSSLHLINSTQQYHSLFLRHPVFLRLYLSSLFVANNAIFGYWLLLTWQSSLVFEFLLGTMLACHAFLAAFLTCSIKSLASLFCRPYFHFAFLYL